MNDRDKKIIRHVEEFGFITIKQCYLMFFNKAGYGYDSSRKRLNILVKKGYLDFKMDNFIHGFEKIFFIDKAYSSTKKHTILIMDSYAKLIQLGANVKFFKREQEWLGGSRRSDGYCIFELGEYIYDLFIEVEGITSNKKYGRKEVADDFNIKYTDVISSREPQRIINKLYGAKGKDTETTRRILVVDAIEHIYPWEVDEETVIQSDVDLQGISKVIQ